MEKINCLLNSLEYLLKWPALLTWLTCLKAPAFQMGAGSCFSCFISHSALCLWPGEQLEDGPKPGTLAPLGDLEETFGFQLWISSTLAIEAFWVVSQQMDDLSSLSLSHFLSKSGFLIKTNICKSFLKRDYLWRILF